MIGDRKGVWGMTNSARIAGCVVAAVLLGAGPAQAGPPDGSAKKVVANCSPGEHLAAWLASVVTDNWCKGNGAVAKNGSVENSAKASGKNFSQSNKGKSIS